MTSDRKNFNWFFQELKRRHVLRVVAMYAPGAFILLEVMDIITPALSLPPWTVTMTIIVLAVGFPVTIVLSWIFDITPEGVIKTGDIESSSETESLSKPGRRRLRGSDVVIAVLVVVVGFLIYPKIFSKDKLSGIRDQDGKISVAILPFENLAGDTAYNVWQGGFQNLLITTLSNSEEISVRQYQAVKSVLEDNKSINYASLTPALANDLANKLETKTLILGNILKAGNSIRVNAQLVDAETEEIYKTYLVEGDSEDDFFEMADSLSGLIKNFIEIKSITDQYNSLATRSVSFTRSSQAFKYYIHGFDAFMELKMKSAAEWFAKAIEADSSFITPYVFSAYTYSLMGNNRQSRFFCKTAHKKRDGLAMEERLLIDQLYAYYFETPNEEITYLNQLVEIDELNPLYWQQLGFAHYKLFEYEEALVNFEQALDITKKWGVEYRNPFIYFIMGNAYHKTGDHENEEEILELGLSLFPNNYIMLQFQAICALSMGEMKEANEILSSYKYVRKNIIHCTEAMITGGLGHIYKEAGMLDEAEKQYRHLLELQPRNPNAMNNLAWFLIDKDVNVDEGVELLDEALKLQPDNWYFLDSKGWGLYKQGKYEEALKILKDAWEHKPIYHHASYLKIQEVERTVASLN
ncbi:MAG: tetratricopeptide repeat protein [Bacteroidota bacterium]